MELALRVAGAVLSGFLFSQSAEFAQQYLQRLGGAADALGAVVARFDATAGSVGLSREEAVRRLRDAPEGLVSRQGDDAAATIARYEDVARRYRALADAAPLFRPFVAASDPDGELLSGVAADYRPAVPATADGLALTLAGFAGGWMLGSGAAAGLRRRRRKPRAVLAKG